MGNIKIRVSQGLMNFPCIALKDENVNELRWCYYLHFNYKNRRQKPKEGFYYILVFFGVVVEWKR